MGKDSACSRCIQTESTYQRKMVARELTVWQRSFAPSHFFSRELPQALYSKLLGLLIKHIIDCPDELVADICEGPVFRVPEHTLQLYKPLLILSVFDAHLFEG